MFGYRREWLYVSHLSKLQVSLKQFGGLLNIGVLFVCEISFQQVTVKMLQVTL